jgi:hypothetical protein
MFTAGSACTGTYCALKFWEAAVNEAGSLKQDDVILNNCDVTAGGTFSLNLSGATNGTIEDATTTVTIVTATTPTVTKVSPNSGPTTGGTPITITGTGFIAGATVVIGQGSGSVTGVIAATSVVVVSSTEITAVTGSGAKAGTWALFVHTTGGTSTATGASDFTYN